MVLLASSGCATGPVRYKTLGRYEYTTIEWTRRAPVMLKPIAAIGGTAMDVAIAGVDTVFTPVVSIPIAARAAFWGPDPGSRNFMEHPFSETILTLVFYPIWFSVFYPVTIYGQTYESPGTPYFDAFYPDRWGDESRAYKVNPISRTQKDEERYDARDTLHKEMKLQESLTLEERRRIRDENQIKQNASNQAAHDTARKLADPDR